MSGSQEILTTFFTELEELSVPRKTVLLKEGDQCKKVYFILKGIVRMWLNHHGKDVTFQFFFEGSGFSSVESLMENRPSQFNLEAITDCELIAIQRIDFLKKLDTSKRFKDLVFKQLYLRLYDFQNLFLSRIKDNPEVRYLELIRDHPKIVKNIPQHYIASYLGITPVSLSRIRNRI